MRIYHASSEETLRARKLLAEWSGDGLITQEQYRRLERETVSQLRTTNVFLRLVLFLFTLLGVAAAIGLFFVSLPSPTPERIIGTLLLIFATVCYTAAEVAAREFHFYRHGVEEALAVCSVGVFCLGMQFALFSGYHLAAHRGSQFVVPAAGAVFLLWIWRRFGLWYAFPAAMIFGHYLPGYWTSSLAAQHMIVVPLYSIGLIWVAVVGSRRRLDSLEDDYSLAEAFLWLGIYLAVNLRLSSLALLPQWMVGGVGPASEFPRPFYWTTWVLIWCLPAVILARGIRRKNRFVMAVGGIAAILTFVTNKPYLGWPRHTWDPMLLGIVLIGVALFVRRWLERGPGGIRGGFTASRQSAKDKEWMGVSSSVVGLVTPQSITPAAQTTGADFRFGGGASGGGGAGGDF